MHTAVSALIIHSGSTFKTALTVLLIDTVFATEYHCHNNHPVILLTGQKQLYTDKKISEESILCVNYMLTRVYAYCIISIKIRR